MTCTAVTHIEAFLNQQHRLRSQAHVQGWLQQWGMQPAPPATQQREQRVAPREIKAQEVDHAKAEKLLKDAYRRQAMKNKKQHDERMKKRVTIKESPRDPSKTTRR